MTPDDNVANTDVGQPADIVVTDKELFDQAVAPEPEKAPEPAPEQAAPQQPTQEQVQRARDEQGRFAPKGQQPQQPPEQPQQQQQPRTEDHRVPLAELHRERARAQRAEAEMAQMQHAWAYFQQQQLAAQQQQQRQQQPEQPQQTIFDNPDVYLNERVISPMQQWGQMEIMKVKDGLSRSHANDRFGEEVVNTALQDLSSIRYTPQGDFIFKQIMASGHPYGELVKWHHTAKAQQAIGPDPKAWLQRQQQAWFNDPTVQAKMIEHVRAQQQQNGNGRPPQVNLPPSLSSMPAASGRSEEGGDLSSASLYRFATK
jgi:hypothetical protein